MAPCPTHIALEIEGAQPAATQPVAALPSEDGTYEVIYTPGLVEGVAAGDAIRLLDVETGKFEVVRRGGNLAIKIFAPTKIEPLLAHLMPRLGALGGRLDGQVARAPAVTILAQAGLEVVGQVMDEACTHLNGATWYFSNVYDAEGRQLDWL